MTTPVLAQGATPNISSFDGNLLTIRQWMNNPKTIPTYVINLMDQGFLPDVVLRNAGGNNSGAVQFNESPPLYADVDVMERAEFEEIELVPTSTGELKTVFSVERAMGLIVTDQDRNRNSTDKLDLRMSQIRNTTLEGWNNAYVNAVIRSTAQRYVATHPWATPGYDIRGDILSIMKMIRLARDPNGKLLGYRCKHMIINPVTTYDLLRSKDFNAEYYGGDIADQNLRYTGLLPQQIMSLNVLECDTMPEGKAIFTMDGAGFISDEEPLQATPMYRQNERRLSRTDLWRTAAIGIDRPLGIVVADGLY